MVDRDDDNTAKEAPEKCNDPLSGVFAPQQNGVPLRYVSGFQFARKAVCRFADLSVRPAFHAIAAPLPNGNFSAEGRVIPRES
jgi:hypothetical protein